MLEGRLTVCSSPILTIRIGLYRIRSVCETSTSLISLDREKMRVLCSIVMAMFSAFAGCHSLPLASQQTPVSNPIQVRANNYDLVWERTIDTLHEYQFAISKENRLSGEIETEYKTGASLFEPWHFDAANTWERTEGTLQSIRRKILVHITQIDGGYMVSVEAFKELEDLPGVASNAASGATFREGQPLRRDLNLVSGQTVPSGWIFKGRDKALEQSLIKDLVQNLQGR